MQRDRRTLILRGGAFAALAAGGLLGAADARAAASDELAFDAVSMQDALRALGGIPAVGTQVVLSVPELVENGSVVPVTVECRLPRAREIYIVVEHNPNPVAARFTIPEGTEAFVSTRLKLAESGPVYAVVRADGRLYSASCQTKVLIGGCA